MPSWVEQLQKTQQEFEKLAKLKPPTAEEHAAAQRETERLSQLLKKEQDVVMKLEERLTTTRGQHIGVVGTGNEKLREDISNERVRAHDLQTKREDVAEKHVRIFLIQQAEKKEEIQARVEAKERQLRTELKEKQEMSQRLAQKDAEIARKDQEIARLNEQLDTEKARADAEKTRAETERAFGRDKADRLKMVKAAALGNGQVSSGGGKGAA